jgi:hypothetical protein
VAAWKEGTPTKGHGAATESALTSPTGNGDGLISMKRRADRVLSSDMTSGGNGIDTPRTMSSRVPPLFNVSELSHYAKGNQDVSAISFWG